MNVAFIPVRGGSKSIPLKNIKNIAGHPLVYWTAKAANDCKNIDAVYVATDSEEIKNVVNGFGLPKVSVIDRSKESATDSASTESAMLEFASKYEFDNLYLIQATSPLLTAYDLEQGYAIFENEDTDSVLSVVRQKRFHWKCDDNGLVKPANYDVYHRPRRQEFEGYLVENGAFYITSRKLLLDSKNRISGNIRAYEMDEATYFEIDEPSDWIIVEKLLEQRTNKEEISKIPEIKMFLTDCDGCLTDGGMYYSENGDELKRFCTLDGMGFSFLRKKGIITGIVTGEDRELNRRRAKKLHIDILKGGVENKAEVILQLSDKYKIDLENIAYVGDDVNDLGAVKMVGYGCAVQNAAEEVKAVAKYVTKKRGGTGAVREVIDLIMQSQPYMEEG